MSAPTSADGGAPHFITTIYVRDAAGRVVALKELTANDREATLAFDFPVDVRDAAKELTAHAYCNLHGTWKSQVVRVG